MEISNKVALITGGASGLGLATAKTLVESGANVMLVDLNEDNVKNAVESLGDKSSYVVANVTEEESVQNAVDETVKKFGGIHIAVNCAGTGYPGRILGKEAPHPLDAFKFIINLNLVGTFNVMRIAAELMD